MRVTSAKKKKWHFQRQKVIYLCRCTVWSFRTQMIGELSFFFSCWPKIRYMGQGYPFFPCPKSAKCGYGDFWAVKSAIFVQPRATSFAFTSNGGTSESSCHSPSHLHRRCLRYRWFYYTREDILGNSAVFLIDLVNNLWRLGFSSSGNMTMGETLILTQNTATKSSFR